MHKPIIFGPGLFTKLKLKYMRPASIKWICAGHGVHQTLRSSKNNIFCLGYSKSIFVYFQKG